MFLLFFSSIILSSGIPSSTKNLFIVLASLSEFLKTEPPETKIAFFIVEVQKEGGHPKIRFELQQKEVSTNETIKEIQ
ncbi:hypothetical protein, partial [Balnearium lithotrophicum]|uniref:hypothetical protein n=1 Tax=Balnearium lithotrophicum TaxID=223788 RepID=UPI001FE840C9